MSFNNGDKVKIRIEFEAEIQYINKDSITINFINEDVVQSDGLGDLNIHNECVTKLETIKN